LGTACDLVKTALDALVVCKPGQQGMDSRLRGNDDEALLCFFGCGDSRAGVIPNRRADGL